MKVFTCIENLYDVAGIVDMASWHLLKGYWRLRQDKKCSNLSTIIMNLRQNRPMFKRKL